MKNTFKSLFLLVALSTALVACNKEAAVEPQQDAQLNTPVMHELGLNFLPRIDYEAIQAAQMPEGINLKALPVSITLTSPPVGDQGGEGSCVAWGTTYAGRSTLWLKTHAGSWSQSVNIFSPEYVYNQIKAAKSCGSGAYVTTGLNLLKSKGACTWTSMPYTDVSCTLLPTAAQNTEAAKYKISGYSTVAITTDAIKAQLYAGNPVIVGGSVNMAFEYLANNAVLGAFKKPSLGGHCYCVVGYDDAKSAFKFQNSWGTSWASAGFGWISYANIKSWWTEAYVMAN